MRSEALPSPARECLREFPLRHWQKRRTKDPGHRETGRIELGGGIDRKGLTSRSKFGGNPDRADHTPGPSAEDKPLESRNKPGYPSWTQRFIYLI